MRYIYEIHRGEEWNNDTPVNRFRGESSRLQADLSSLIKEKKSNEGFCSTTKLWFYFRFLSAISGKKTNSTKG